MRHNAALVCRELEQLAQTSSIVDYTLTFIFNCLLLLLCALKICQPIRPSTLRLGAQIGTHIAQRYNLTIEKTMPSRMGDGIELSRTTMEFPKYL